MSDNQTTKVQRTSTGVPMRHTSVGGYPILYLTKKNGVLCAGCAAENESEVAHSDVHWEGAPLDCEECGEEIESAYGECDEDWSIIEELEGKIATLVQEQQVLKKEAISEADFTDNYFETGLEEDPQMEELNTQKHTNHVTNRGLNVTIATLSNGLRVANLTPNLVKFEDGTVLGGVPDPVSKDFLYRVLTSKSIQVRGKSVKIMHTSYLPSTILNDAIEELLWRADYLLVSKEVSQVFNHNRNNYARLVCLTGPQDAYSIDTFNQY